MSIKVRRRGIGNLFSLSGFSFARVPNEHSLKGNVIDRMDR